MESSYESFRRQASSVMRRLREECPEFADAELLLGSADTEASLFKHDIYKTIDTEWIEVIEQTLPYLDLVIRQPAVAIEDVDEILPVELSRHITEKSVKHLAQHTNFILDIKDDEVTPQKLLNVYHDETYLTYENKFVNTLLARLSAFVDKRYRALLDGSGTERAYKFDYKTEFEHHLSDDGGRNSARIHLRIELTSPLETDESGANIEINEQYRLAFERIRRIHMALVSYQSSEFAKKLGRNYVRPPVIRTNAILKNKNLRECLGLWEYIETFEKVGYTMRLDEDVEMPSSNYIGDLYSSVAMQYVNFYNGVAESDDNRLLSQKHLYDLEPEFAVEREEDLMEDYRVYDSEYHKTVPVSRLMNNRKKLSDDERRLYRAIVVCLKADELLTAEEDRLKEEERRRRMQAAEEEEAARLRAAEEAEAKRLAEEEAKRLAAEEARRAEEEAKRLAAEEARRAEEEAKRLAEEEARRLAAEEARRIAEEAERAAAAMAMVFADEADESCDSAVVPYTRAQYLALPRKKKKRVLMNVRRLIEYRETQKLIATLRETGADDERTRARIALLEEQCDLTERFLSQYALWQDSVRRNQR